MPEVHFLNEYNPYFSVTEQTSAAELTLQILPLSYKQVDIHQKMVETLPDVKNCNSKETINGCFW